MAPLASTIGRFHETCRLCHGSDLHQFLDLGLQPHSDGFLREEQLKEEEHFFPLATALCHSCGQVQLTYVVPPEFLWSKEYVYDSSVTQTGRDHFMAMAAQIVDDYRIEPGSLTIDIGSNVGLLLSGFAAKGMNVLGVDPAPKPVEIANRNGMKTKLALFSEAVAHEVTKEHGQAKVITATNVFAHIDDLDDIMAGIDALLSPEGIFVIEAPYLTDLIERLEYDTIYHQHLSYLSVIPLSTFFQRFGMEIFNVIRTTIHGGSLRYFVARSGKHPVRPIVTELMEQERGMELHSPTVMDSFAVRVTEHRRTLTEMLRALKNDGKSIAGLSAPAKGNTLLNYCGIDTSILDFVTEKNAMKIGLYTPGTHIPIVPDSALLERKPDVALLLAWNFAPEIMRNQKEFSANGGQFLIPIPTPILQ